MCRIKKLKELNTHMMHAKIKTFSRDHVSSSTKHIAQPYNIMWHMSLPRDLSILIAWDLLALNFTFSLAASLHKTLQCLHDVSSKVCYWFKQRKLAKMAINDIMSEVWTPSFHCLLDTFWEWVSWQLNIYTMKPLSAMAGCCQLYWLIVFRCTCIMSS